MALPIRITKTLAAASDTAIALSQTPGGAGNLTLNGALVVAGVAILDTSRRVLLTFAADETGHNFTIYGTLANTGAAISEVIAGTTPGTAYTTQDFKTVTRVAISAAATGAIKVGTNGIGSTHWILTNYNISPFAVGFEVEVTGTLNYTVQSTGDNPLDQVQSNFPPNVVKVPVAFDHPTVAAQTSSKDGNYAFPPGGGIRLLINSGTGTAVFCVTQAGIRN